MRPFTVLTAVAAPLEIAKIDTGMILPGRYMRRHRRPGHDYAEAFLYDLRFDDKGRPREDFVLSHPAYRDARILVTDGDFGCGSSREGAAFAVMDYGLQALVGPSYLAYNSYHPPGRVSIRTHKQWVKAHAMKLKIPAHSVVTLKLRR